MSKIQSKKPPQDTSAEMCALGSMMSDSELEYIPDIMELLSGDDFYILPHQTVFRAIKNLYNRSAPIDVVTVRDELERMDQFDRSDKRDETDKPNIDTLVNMLESVVSISNAVYYASMVKQKSVLRNVISVCSKAIDDAYDPMTDQKGFLDKLELKIHQIVSPQKTKELVMIGDVVAPIVEEICQRTESRFTTGIPTGFIGLDGVIDGMHPGDMIIIAGRPSMGKTMLAMNIAEYVSVEQNMPVGIFSLEMNKEDLARRMLSSVGGIEHEAIKHKEATQSTKERLRGIASRLADVKMVLNVSPTLNPAELRSRARGMQRKHDIKLIVIDYVQLMGGVEKNQKRHEEIGDISRQIKTLAGELGVPIIVVAQLNRMAESRTGNRPKLSDLKESGSLEQDADKVIMLYREKYYRLDKGDETELIIEKNRNGECRVVHVQFNGSMMRFEE